MDRKLAEAPAWVPEIETPPHLRAQCQAMQLAAPYLGLGFRKERLDSKVHARLVDHLRKNVGRFQTEPTVDEIGTAAVNVIPTLLFDDQRFNNQLAEELRPAHEEWAGRSLLVSYCYGLRCYQRGAFLYNHVDRLPHFVSSTICVDHALQSPWPLHIESIDGVASQIDMEPGDMVFYEGARLVHGRPYPLDGDFYVGIFVHYYPTGGAMPVIGR